ncbi:hypothetical protein BDV96DRAFT_644454 [Lophiotrema nucula]|uniref:Uncharacterized protein n=1 Tax=Lophiotrema nucula TaxID=690887 RepID=A0A6A5ZE63_9PLEO|nr:hypothetical protein BDV96DRAFT_644454 [Lophiotrema nucula]
MQTSGRPAQDTACSTQPNFPLLKLSRELRNEIYELAIEPYAEFYLKDLDDPWDHTEMRFCLPNLGTTPASSDESKMRFVLFYRFFLFHALMVTCKPIEVEVREVIPRVNPQIHSFIRAQIWRDQIISKDPAFFEMCRRSTFICGVNAQKMVRFMELLGRELRLCIGHIVFVQCPKSESVQSTLEAWEPPSRHRSPLFPRFLELELPNLTTLSIRFPELRTSYDPLYTNACEEMCDMVLLGHINTLYYLCPTEHPIESLPLLAKQAPAPNADEVERFSKGYYAAQPLVYVRERKRIFDADVVVRITSFMDGCLKKGGQVRYFKVP